MNKISTLRDFSVLNVRIKKLMRKKKLSISALSKKTDISVGAIQKITSSPECNPTLEKIELIAKALDVPISFLIGESDNSSTPQIKIPIISWSDISKMDWENFNLSEITTNDHIKIFDDLSDQTFALRMQGKSMAPVFTEKSILIFDPKKKAYDGCYALFYIYKTKSYIFRELAIDGTTYYYKSCNVNFGVELTKLLEKDKIISILTKSEQSY